MAPYKLIAIARAPSCVVVRLPDPASAAGATWQQVVKQLRTEVVEFIEEERPTILCIDFNAISACPILGSSGSLLRCQILRSDLLAVIAQLAKKYNITVRLIGLSDDIRQLFAVLRYDRLFEVETGCVPEDP